jgi:hypothetical protein
MGGFGLTSTNYERAAVGALFGVIGYGAGLILAVYGIGFFIETAFWFFAAQGVPTILGAAIGWKYADKCAP